jgi:hypothetical protein
MNLLKILGILVTTFFLSGVDVRAATGVMDVLWTCSTDTETRTLSIGEKEGGGCELHYEKHDQIKVVAWGSSGTDHCERARDKIRDELKKAGWKCTKTKM